MTETRMKNNRSRALVFSLAFGLLCNPLIAEAQPPPGKTARIGYLSFSSGPSLYDEAFRQGLRELGYVEGQNIVVEYRWADFKADRAASLAAELVRLKVDVIVSTRGSTTAGAAKRATTTIPIVFDSGDPVGLGLVTRLDRPGGNLTGLNNFTWELNVKRLELLTQALPGVSRVAVLVKAGGARTDTRLKELEDAARALRVKLHVVEVRQPQEIAPGFAAMARARPDAVLVMNDPMFSAERDLIVGLVVKHRMPAIGFFRDFAEAGGLMSYAPSFADIYRRLATYVDKILKGAKPGDLPIEQPTKFEMIVNLKTARALGLTVPQSILLRADQVID